MIISYFLFLCIIERVYFACKCYNAHTIYIVLFVDDYLNSVVHSKYMDKSEIPISI